MLFLVFVPFSISPDFSSKISPQLFKIETSNLVYRFTTTNYNVGLKMEILLFVLPCIFLSKFLSKIPAIHFGSAKAGVESDFLTVLVPFESVG